MARTSTSVPQLMDLLALERYRYPILRTNSSAEFVEKQIGQLNLGVPNGASLVLKPLAVMSWRGSLTAWRRARPRSLPGSWPRLLRRPILHLRTALIGTVLASASVRVLLGAIVVVSIPSIVGAGGALRRRGEGPESVIGSVVF